MKNFLLSIIFLIRACLVFSSKLPDVCPNIIKKSEWGGRQADKIAYTVIPLKYVIIHHTVTSKCMDPSSCSRTLANMQNYHMGTLKFDDIGYNFLIGGDGNVYEGAGWHRLGAHARGYNKISIGVAFIGDFSTEKPTPQQLEAGKKLIECGIALKDLDSSYKLLGAKSLRPTESPGAALFSEIQGWKGFTTKP
uniref:Peptidoglycan-recognition protein n=1 Tax=Holotrichia oblita TaxID=644536 RepID=A0A8D4J3X2_HOLOL|nr:GPRP2 [Holotrichia oblita]